MKKILWFFGIVIIGLIGFCIYFLNAAMPTGTGYSAKYICSQVFLAERDPAVVFENDVKPTHPLFGVIKFKVNRDTKTVTAKGDAAAHLQLIPLLKNYLTSQKDSSLNNNLIHSACGLLVKV